MPFHLFPEHAEENKFGVEKKKDRRNQDRDDHFKQRARDHFWRAAKLPGLSVPPREDEGEDLRKEKQEAGEEEEEERDLSPRRVGEKPISDRSSGQIFEKSEGKTEEQKG